MFAQLRIPDAAAWRAIEHEHPRWKALLCLHGEQRKSAVTGSSAGVLWAELIELTIRSTAADAGHLPAITRRLPNGLPIKSIKAMAGALFRVEPTRQVLLYSRPEAHKNDIPEVLDDDLKTLCDFGVVSGGTIIVEEEG